MEARDSKTPAQATVPDGLAKTVAFLTKLVNPLSGVVGAIIASSVLAFMMFLTFFDVAGRFLLNKPINGSLELTEFSMALLVAFGLGYCALRKGHIRVDLILQYTSRKTTLWIDIFTYSVSSIFYMFLTWQTWLNAASVMNSKLTSSVILIPVFPFSFLVSIGAGLLVLVFLRDLLQTVEEVRK
jgi:TRAP-type transport system small permease protein